MSWISESRSANPGSGEMRNRIGGAPERKEKKNWKRGGTFGGCSRDRHRHRHRYRHGHRHGYGRGVVGDISVGDDTTLALELGLPPAARVLLGHGEHITNGERELDGPVGGVGMQGLNRSNWRGRRLGGG